MSDYCELPGGRCTACCRYGDCMHLKPLEIQVDAKGDCVHLTSQGCSIWPRCPAPANDGFDCSVVITDLWWEQAAVPARLVEAALARCKRG